MRDRTTTFLAIGVFVIWAASMILDGLNPNYDPPAAIHGAITLVLGGIFGARALGKNA